MIRTAGDIVDGLVQVRPLHVPFPHSIPQCIFDCVGSLVHLTLRVRRIGLQVCVE